MRLLLRTLVSLLWGAFRCFRAVRPRRPLPPGRPRTVLLTGTFYSENWILNHLRPLAASTACSQVWIVTTFPIPPAPKAAVVRPPRWLCRVLGDTPARLLVFLWLGLRHRPDVVGGFHILINGLLAPVLARLVGARSVYFCGGGAREFAGGGHGSGNRVFRRLREPDPILERQLLRGAGAADVIVTMGRRVIPFFREHGVTTRIEVIPGSPERPPHENAAVAKTYDVVLVGRLWQVKRIDLFLEAVQCLTRSRPDLAAVVVGGGELEESLKAKANEMGLARHVLFTGHQDDVARWLQASKVFVLTSDSEGLSLALMEAMACGLPCVVSDVGELGELVEHGRNGFLVTERSGPAFARHIETLLGDDALRAAFSAAAHQAAAQFEVSEMARRWDRVLTEI